MSCRAEGQRRLGTASQAVAWERVWTSGCFFVEDGVAGNGRYLQD